MGEQGLAERLAAETARSLSIAEELGDRLYGQLEAERLTARMGVRLPPPNRDFCRVHREYRSVLEKLRLEAILRARLKINLVEEPPLTDEEYRMEFEQIQRLALSAVDRESLELELAARPTVRLPKAGSVVLDVPSVEVAAPRGMVSEPSLARPGRREQEDDAPDELQEQPTVARVAPADEPNLAEPDPDDGEGWDS